MCGAASPFAARNRPGCQPAIPTSGRGEATLMFGVITDFASSHWGKWIIIAAWVVVAAMLIPLAPSLSSVTSNDAASFLPKNAESTRVQELVSERFPANGTPVILVFHRQGGLTDADKTAVRHLSTWATSPSAPSNIDRHGVVSIATVPEAASRLISADGATMTMVINITSDPASDAYAATVDAVNHELTQLPDGLSAYVSGPGGLLHDLIGVFSRIDVFLTAVTAGLVLVLLILIYRSPIVALVPLVVVGWVFSLAGAIGALAAEHAGLLVNGQARGIMTVLLFGAGTDYCLFIATRFREELESTADKHVAMQRAMRGVGEAIASAAGTVLVACLLLLFAELRSNAALGPLLAIAIAMMLLAALTLVPAILATLGRFAFWPFRPVYQESHDHRRLEQEHHGVWTRVAQVVAHRPATVLAVTFVLFAFFTSGLLTYRVTYDTLRALPADTPSRAGFELLRKAFPAGQLAPTDVYVVLPSGQKVDDWLVQIERLSTVTSKMEGVASVQGPANPIGVGTGPGAAQIAAAAREIPAPVRQAIVSGNAGSTSSGGSDPRVSQAIGLYAQSRSFVSPDGNVAHLSVVLDANPYGTTAINEIPSLRDRIRRAARASGLGESEVLVGGQTATQYDTKVANDRDTRVVLPLILLAIGIILAVLLRSLVAPLYLLATIVLSYAATLGLSTVFFLHVFGNDGVSSAVPFYLFVFLVALGVDYNIYLMARIREESARMAFTPGVRRAIGRTGGVITSAGIILAGTFAALMTLPLRDLFQLGFAVALGVLLDTFIVRTLMVPAIVLLLGRWNWWPTKPAAVHDDARAGEEALTKRT